MKMTRKEEERYARQMMLEGWGEAGQERLKKSCVFIAGAGGLGSPVALYLAVAGVGHLRVCDFDVLERTNLNRQILHDESGIGNLKTESALKTLRRMNPDIRVTICSEKIDGRNADDLVGEADVIADCMDNFRARYILNRTAFRKRTPFVYGSIWGMDGRLSFFFPPETPCFQCLFPEGPPKETFPVLGATPGVIGSLQAMEILKYLTATGTQCRDQSVKLPAVAIARALQNHQRHVAGVGFRHILGWQAQ